MRAIATMNLVRRMLTLEAAKIQDQESVNGAAERVADQLRVHLSKRIGQEGFRTLMARALALTTAQFPHLNAVRVGTDGSLIGLRVAMGRGLGEAQDEEIQRDAKATQQDIVEGAVALVAHLLGLLITLIGEDLTLRLLSTVSPELAIPELALDDVADREDGRL